MQQADSTPSTYQIRLCGTFRHVSRMKIQGTALSSSRTQVEQGRPTCPNRLRVTPEIVVLSSIRPEHAHLQTMAGMGEAFSETERGLSKSLKARATSVPLCRQLVKNSREFMIRCPEDFGRAREKDCILGRFVAEAETSMVGIN